MIIASGATNDPKSVVSNRSRDDWHVLNIYLRLTKSKGQTFSFRVCEIQSLKNCGCFFESQFLFQKQKINYPRKSIHLMYILQNLEFFEK